MTKTQKIWLWIFIGMFTIPEFLWSPVGNFTFQFLQNNNSPKPLRDNFLLNPDHANLLNAFFLVQLLGLVSTLIFLLINHKLIANKLLLWVSCIILFLLAAFVLLIFGLSNSLRHIGF